MLDAKEDRLSQRWAGITTLALVAATYPLWTPQTVFPQIPVLEVFCVAPRWLDWVCLVGLIVGLTLLVKAKSRRLVALGCMGSLASMVLFCCLDQHRFQPWAYQLGLFLVVWLVCPTPSQNRWLRLLMISIYLFSAVGKLDYEFLHSVGQQMLGAISVWVGVELASIPGGLRPWLVVLFPIMELAIALGLATKKFRLVSGYSAIGLHVVLLFVLGPLGLNHRLGVLVWNVQFAGFAYLLFVRNGDNRQIVGTDTLNSQVNGKAQPVTRSFDYRTALCGCLVGAAVCLPTTERFGLWDHWPSWALYAPHSSRVRVSVAGPSLTRLPGELLNATNVSIDASNPIHEWVDLSMDAWSLRVLDTPIYPQARFQLGVARWIANEVDSEFQVQIVVLGIANRFTGNRQREVLEGNTAIENAVRKYWLNTRPREF